MKHPSPALVSQDAARRLPRSLLLLLCLVYILAGFVGRSPWKSEDMASYGYMQALAQGRTQWLAPHLLNLPAEPGQWLHLWLGAISIQLAPEWFSAELASRLPFMLLVGLSLLCVWYSCYFLARTADAQPVPFAFGGEAAPADYARALADGAVLAMLASLGFAQFSHEAAIPVVQLAGGSLVLLAFSIGFFHFWQAAVIYATGTAVLLLSGAGHGFLLASAGAIVLSWWSGWHYVAKAATGEARTQFLVVSQYKWFLWPLLATLIALVAAGLIWYLQLWFWQVVAPWQRDWSNWRSIARLLVWFSWPVWPLCLWALWRWRKQWWTRSPSFHILLPLWFAVFAVLLAVFSASVDKTLFVGLPVFAVLAAFALPAMRRSVSALIDWFTLLFFTVCGIAIWVIWVATQTGIPAKPAANVAKLAPEYVPQFFLLSFLLALLATIAWLAVVVWRTGRHQAAIWKSLVLPAGGATWCLVLLMTLWLPMLDYGRGYRPQIQKLHQYLPVTADCVNVQGLRRAQIAAFQELGQWRLADSAQYCTWALVGVDVIAKVRPALRKQGWEELARVERPTDDEPVFVFRRDE